MPRYRYICLACHNEQLAFHLYDETPLLQCEGCDNLSPLVRALTSPTYLITKSENGHKKVGEVTKEYIDLNREILEEEKKKAKEENYEPS